MLAPAEVTCQLIESKSSCYPSLCSLDLHFYEQISRKLWQCLASTRRWPVSWIFMSASTWSKPWRL